MQQAARPEVEAMDTSLKPNFLEESEKMDIGDLDLEGIEKAYSDKVKGYVPQEQVSLLKEAILKDKFSNSLSINSSPFKETNKFDEDNGKKLRRKSNKHRVADVGRQLVDSGQYPKIRAAIRKLEMLLVFNFVFNETPFLEYSRH